MHVWLQVRNPPGPLNFEGDVDRDGNSIPPGPGADGSAFLMPVQVYCMWNYPAQHATHVIPCGNGPFRCSARVLVAVSHVAMAGLWHL